MEVTLIVTSGCSAANNSFTIFKVMSGLSSTRWTILVVTVSATLSTSLQRPPRLSSTVPVYSATDKNWLCSCWFDSEGPSGGKIILLVVVGRYQALFCLVGHLCIFPSLDSWLRLTRHGWLISIYSNFENVWFFANLLAEIVISSHWVELECITQIAVRKLLNWNEFAWLHLKLCGVKRTRWHILKLIALHFNCTHH